MKDAEVWFISLIIVFVTLSEKRWTNACIVKIADNTISLHKQYNYFS